MLSEQMQKLVFLTPSMLGIPSHLCNGKKWNIAERGMSVYFYFFSFSHSFFLIYVYVYVYVYICIELLQINTYCSPREKLRTILNCCKVIIRMSSLSLFSFFLLGLFPSLSLFLSFSLSPLLRSLSLHRSLVTLVWERER